MKKFAITVAALLALVGGAIVAESNFKHGFKATHAEVHLETYSPDFTESNTLGFGDKGHVEVIELSSNQEQVNPDLLKVETV